MMFDKKRRWVTMPFIITILICLSGAHSYASTFQSLSEAKDGAWNTYYKSMGSTGDSSAMEEIAIDGAVDKRGGVKIKIDDWEDKAILKEGKDLPVYESSDGISVIGKIYSDSVVTVISAEGDWTKIHSGYLQGYVKRNSMYYQEKAEQKAAEVCPVKVLSNVWDTPIMSEPDGSSKIVDYMQPRKTYDILNTKGNWIEIEFEDSMKGYVSLKDTVQARKIHFGRSLIDINNPQRPFIKENISEEERRLLAAIIFCEARGEVFEGQVAVGAVVMNRVHSDEFPNTITEVIYQDNQFEPVLMNRFEKVLKDDRQITDICYEAADVVIQGGNNIGDALFFRTGNMGTQIGSHGFY